MNSKQESSRRGLASRIAVALAAAFAAAGAVSEAAPLVSQTPLSAGGVVPSNVVLTPSVEFPTVNSKANIDATFNGSKAYYGYFDPNKCYLYKYDADEAKRHFYPDSVSASSPAKCNGASKQWSGNYLNWATTQTIDGFRKALTGGLRVRDEAGETWLEKARHDGQGGETYYPIAKVDSDSSLQNYIPTAAYVSTNTATGWNTITTRVYGGNNEMYFTASCTGTGAWSVKNGTIPSDTAVAYDPDSHVLNRANNAAFTNPTCGSSAVTATNANIVFRVSVRVKVCVSGLLEDNCVAYGSNYKPEGLIQKYQGKMRFSVFGYLVDNEAYRDGGVLRANQKYVGPKRLDKDTGLWVDNENKEWNPETGVFYAQPNVAAQDETNTYGNLTNYKVANSGVINYINKFAQNNGIVAKNFDPVSELYYTATRYLRGGKLRDLDNIDRYSNLKKKMNNTTGTNLSELERWKLTDNFPVITKWEDPFQFWCQNTAIIGIGDVYTHKDKNLPGNTSTDTDPAWDDSKDKDVDLPVTNTTTNKNVLWWTKKVYELEDLTFPAIPFNGLQSAPYIAGLAYFMHTQDMRPDLGPNNEKQTASTHWVDVRERQRIEPRRRNQYWLAAKYGGFLVPDGYDSLTNTESLDDLNAAWDSGESLGMTNGENSGTYPNERLTRANNYYTGEAPDKMISGLTRAFAKFGSEGKGSGASLAANSTRLDTTTLTFQAQFQNSIWMGQLNAYKVEASGALAATPMWTAGKEMPVWDQRTLYVNAKNGSTDSYQEFTWSNLSTAQKDALQPTWTLPAAADVDGEDVLEYIRGNQAKEENSATGALRTRTPPAGWSAALGDIVNSTPVFVGTPNAALFANSPGNWDGKTLHDDFASSSAGRTPVVWVGSNDGILHAFDASITSGGNATSTSGDEVYGFVPNKAIVSGLVDFANPDYSHKYFIDGDMAVADVYEKGATYNTGTWKTILVGTMGRGGPGVFALDITDPLDVKFLWEHDETTIADLGRNIGRPVIAQVGDADWRVIFGNGPDSASGKASVVLIDVFNGTSTTIDVDSGTANGLSAVLARDNDSDGFVDALYAGDLEGSLWKVTKFEGALDSVVTTKLFSAKDSSSKAQPITAAPLVGRDPETKETWVFFGTGKFLNEDDLTDTQQQSWYGIKDQDDEIVLAEMVERKITATVDTKADGDTANDLDFLLRTLDAAEENDMEGKNGWYIHLPSSKERIVVPNRFQGSALIGTTRIPDASDLCRPTGKGFIMAINPFTGGRLEQTFFDVNRDNKFNDDDKALLDDKSYEIVSGIGIDSSPNNPIFIENVMQFSKDDGTTDSVRVQGSSAEARRASWREITNN